MADWIECSKQLPELNLTAVVSSYNLRLRGILPWSAI